MREQQNKRLEQNELSEARLDAVSGGKSGLVMYCYDGKPVARYHLEAAWPSK